MNQEDQELLQAFLEEIHEHLDGIEGDLLTIEGSAPDLDLTLVNKVFRAVHSVKGGAGFFGLTSILGTSHAMESLLGMLQRRELVPSSEIVGLLLEAADVLASLVADPGTSNDRDVSDLVARLGAVQPGAAPHATTSTQAELPAPNRESLPPKPLTLPPLTTLHHAVGSEPPASALKPLSSGTRGSSVAHGKSENSIRVQLSVLDRLMTLAGELVLTRNQLLQSHEADPPKNADATQRIDHITTELQDAIMATRMQSIGAVFHRFRRVVRDLAQALGKEVDLVLEGEEVELDRTIIEAIGDPLTHLVRNALDHGIERPDIRQLSRKPRLGKLRLSALHKGGQVVIEIQDDGAGIDPARIRAKAAQKGLYSTDQLAAMTDAAVVRLIFRPGFSTAAEVTEVSGRGVGMDVVHSNLARLGGVVDVQSVVGEGTTMRVKLPLTLAIIPCLMITEEGESFAIPQTNLVELHSVPAHDIENRIKRMGSARVFRLRGDLIPLVRLRDVLGIAERTQDAPTPQSRGINIAVVAASDFRYGLVVESLQDSSEIVVKPLGRHLRRCNAYAGATILGDGRVALILDVVSIAQRLRAEESTDAALAHLASQPKPTDLHDGMTLLLAESEGGQPIAIPLGLVARIERVNGSEIQHVVGKRTLGYRGRMLPLVALEDLAGSASTANPRGVAPRFVVVFRSHSREVGLLVTDLTDIVDSTAPLDELTHRQIGIFGSLLIDERVTLLLDVQGIVRQVLGTSAELGTPSDSTKPQARRVLVVDDSRFFLVRLKSFVIESGNQAITATDGQEALDILRQASDPIDLVLTDIEMPRMDGFELARRIRQDEKLRDIPVLAITALMGEEAELRGRQSGIDEYLIKLDRDRLLERVTHYLSRGRSGRAWGAA